MALLWQGKRERKVWQLGLRLEPKNHYNDMAVQGIDHVWDDKGDHIGHVTHCNHANKIEIYGEDCTEVAKAIVDALNAADISQPPRPANEAA